MKQFLYILLCLLSVNVTAQYVQGTVRDTESGRLMANVLVINSGTHRYTFTNDSGYYMLQAATGDSVVFLVSFYHTIRIPATHRVEDVQMKRINYSLDEIQVLPELEKLERDNREMQKTYDKTITDAKRKTKYIPYAGTAAGFTAEGLISSMASGISGQKKKDKRFLRTFEAMQEQKYIATRYNPDIVMATTRTTVDSAITFINAYPMEKDFALQASALELQMWIRYHFNLWVQKEKEGGAPASRPD